MITENEVDFRIMNQGELKRKEKETERDFEKENATFKGEI
jgi:hypothetical protein